MRLGPLPTPWHAARAGTCTLLVLSCLTKRSESVVHTLRRTTIWLAAAILWSCSSSVTGVDRNPGDGVAAIAVAPSSFTLVIGAEAPLQVTVHDESGRLRSDVPVVWTVKDTAIARVSPSGVVRALSVGNTQVAASAMGLSAIATVTVQPPPVASVLVQPLTQALILGQSATFTATPRDVNGAALAGRVVTWTSSRDSIASVSQSGVVTTHAVGTVTVTATSEGTSGSATVTVSPVPVASVSVKPATATLTVGGTVALAAEVKDAAGASLDRTVAWSSGDASIATVSATGVVTAAGVGSTTITAQSEGISATATITVNRVPVSSVAIAPATASLPVGSTVPLAVTVKDAGGSALGDRVVAWSSSNVTVATVSATGVVTGIAPGAVTITATSEGVSGTAALTIVPSAIASVAVAPASASVKVGDKVTLTATVRDASGAVVTDRPVTWVSSNTSVATVSETGSVTANAVGSATISAMAGGKTGSATLTVTAVPVASVTVSPPSLTVSPGQAATLTATVADASGGTLTGRAVAWTSSNTSVATVSAAGVVTAIAPGSATITATSEGMSGTAVVTVAVTPVATVDVNPTTATLIRGETVNLSAVLKDAGGTVLTDRVVTWTSSNNAVAVVSTTGVVSGVAPGTATITATSEGKSATAAVTVVSPPIASVTVLPASDTVEVGGSATLTATVKDVTGAIVPDAAVTWVSSNAAVATVSATGVVTGTAVGVATISATSEGKSGSSSVTVQPVPVASLTLDPASVTLAPDETATLVATTRSADGTVLTGRVVTFASSNVKVATVSSDGIVTGVAPGTATITATSEGKSTTATVTVQPVVAYVIVSPDPVFLKKGGTVLLTAKAYDATDHLIVGRTVTWASDDDHIATVNDSGLVAAKKAGKTTVTATVDGKTGTSSIQVTN